jgi:hypothetical protein
MPFRYPTQPARSSVRKRSAEFVLPERISKASRRCTLEVRLRTYRASRSLSQLWAGTCRASFPPCGSEMIAPTRSPQPRMIMVGPVSLEVTCWFATGQDVLVDSRGMSCVCVIAAHRLNTCFPSRGQSCDSEGVSPVIRNSKHWAIDASSAMPVWRLRGAA